jgi:midasin
MLGTYTFRFSDDLYGLKLSITTRLREPHEISDTPVADYVSLIHDEARDADRRGRRRPHDSDNEDESGDESDDSFIVDDLHGEEHNEPVGSFSDDEGHWQYHDDDEAADEQREQRRMRGRQRSGRRSERDVQFVDRGEDLSGEENEDAPSGPEDAGEHEDEDEADDEVRLGRRNVRLVEEAADSSDGEDGQEEPDEVDDADAQEGKEDDAHAGTHQVAWPPRRRNANQIVDSEDEDEGEPGGSDEEQKENGIAGQDEHTGLEDSGGEATAANEDGSDGSEDTTPRGAGRKVKREQWFQVDDGSEEEHRQSPPDALLSPGEDVEAPVARPRKRARAGDRQVRVVDVAESDEEEEQMERSILVANSTHAREDASEDEGSDSQFRRVHQFDEESDERHEFDAHDYPDEEEEEN